MSGLVCPNDRLTTRLTLDEMIRYWRNERDTHASLIADQYIDALQSVRKSLLGGELA